MDDTNEALPARDDELAQECENLILRLRVEPRRHFIADHAGWIQRQLNAERQAAQLPTRQRGDAFVAVRRETGHPEDGLEPAVTLGRRRNGQPQGVVEGLLDGQLSLGSGKLRGEPDLTH